MSIEASRWAWDQDCTPSQKLVLVALADHADREGKCWPGHRKLVQKTGLSDASVRRAIGVLSKSHLVRVEARKDRSGRQLSNFYYLAVLKEQPGDQGKNQMSQHGHAGGVTTSTKTSHDAIRDINHQRDTPHVPTTHPCCDVSASGNETEKIVQELAVYITAKGNVVQNPGGLVASARRRLGMPNRHISPDEAHELIASAQLIAKTKLERSGVLSSSEIYGESGFENNQLSRRVAADRKALLDAVFGSDGS